MDDKEKSSAILAQISIILDDFIKTNEDKGLLTGTCGAALFYAYYYRLSRQEEYLAKMYAVIEDILNTLGSEQLPYSHCSGLSGIGWCLQHLVKNRFIEQEETEDIFEEVDDVLAGLMEDQLKTGRYDFLHEALGVGLYFVERLRHPKARLHLEYLVSVLEESMSVLPSGISWQDNFTNKRSATTQPAFNLGLAHGVPAILSVLALIYEGGIARNKILPMLEKGVNWLLASKNQVNETCKSLYPVIVNGDNSPIGEKQSRLGWCYGDLGIGIMLINVGRILNNEQYQQEAYAIFEHTSKYRNRENGDIYDACLCHGTMGVSHIFRRAFLATGDPALLQATQLWLHETIQMATWEDGLAGFKYRTPTSYENNYDLLEGITGIGLGLITALDATVDPGWDRCLLLS
jgi:lantibiotic modifying enzyme